MLSRSLIVIGTAIFIAATIVAAAASSSARQAPPPTGTASISGTVIDGVSGAPVRRVIVVVSDQASSFGSRMTVTGDDGGFAFRSLPAGRFIVTGNKAAYLPTAYGVNKPMRPGAVPTGSAIALTAGQQMTDVALRITRGGVVTGVVRGTDGRPVRGAYVGLSYFLRAPMTGERTMSTVPSGNAITDSRGVYRMFGVPPGEYVVSVALFGVTVADLETTTEADVQRMSDPAAPLSGAGAAGRGGPRNAEAAAARRPTYGYATVFHPGTTVLSNATPITLGPGEERGGVDFQLQLVPQSRVSGIVTGLDGRPVAGVTVRMASAFQNPVGPFLPFLFGASDAQGQFMIRGVAAGDYVLEVRPIGGRGVGAPAPTPATTSWARTKLSVAPGVDVSTTVALQPGRTMSGQITIDPSSSAPPPDFMRTRIIVTSRDNLSSLAVVTADGRFTIPGMAPDAYRFSVSMAPAPGAAWSAKSAAIAGRDALDAFVDVADDASATIVLTDRVTEVSGAILDGTGRPAPEYFIVIFPADEKLWAWQSRRIQQARPANDGKFLFRNLPAGEYLIGAVTDLEQYQWFEPAFLSQLLGTSVKIALADGEKKVQDIRLR